MADCLLTDGVTTITLPDDRYLDPDPDLVETGVRQEVAISGAGTAIVQVSEQSDGWEVALRGEMTVPRSTVVALNTLARQPGELLTLTLPDLRIFSVLFAQPGAIEAAPIYGYVPAESSEPYTIALNFITKAP